MNENDKQIPPIENADNQGGWSFWNSVSTISSQIKHVAEDTIDLAYSQLDPEYAEREGSPKKELDSESNSDSRKSPKFEAKNLMDTTENVLSYVDKGFDFASDFVGNALYKGFETTKSLTQNIGLSPPDPSVSGEKSRSSIIPQPQSEKEVLKPQNEIPAQVKKNQSSDLKNTVVGLSSKLMDVSIDTLEGIGKNVYEITPKQKKIPVVKATETEFKDMETYFTYIKGKEHIENIGKLVTASKSSLNWDVDQLLETALDEDDIQSDLLDKVHSKIANAKPLTLQVPKCEKIEDFFKFLCQGSGNSNSFRSCLQ
eukprot:NODE_818_length_3714_cov_0.921162.p2 type:complete len:313 gc:universal NODE_818_length_3714_cov_0.921162:3428-2490(-)